MGLPFCIYRQSHDDIGHQLRDRIADRAYLRYRVGNATAKRYI